MLGVIVNTIAVLLGSTVGLFCKRAIPEKITKAIMLAIGLCTIYIGVSGTLDGENTLVLILSMVFGTAAGTAMDLDRRITQLEPFDRAIILLWLEDMSYDDIAAIAGISVKALATRLVRIRKKFITVR